MTDELVRSVSVDHSSSPSVRYAHHSLKRIPIRINALKLTATPFLLSPPSSRLQSIYIYTLASTTLLIRLYLSQSNDVLPDLTPLR